MKHISLSCLLFFCTLMYGQDTTPPVAVCQDITVQLDATGIVIITALQIDNGSTDDTAIVSYTLNTDNFDCSQVGPNMVTLIVADAAGNTDSCTATVTVEDNQVPMAVCQDIILTLDTAGNATITADQLDGGSIDNCTLNFMASQTVFSCADLGANNITLTVSDSNGNSDTCTAIVTVQELPDTLMAVCQDITVNLDASGNGTITANMLDGGSTGAGSCKTLTFSASRTSFDCTDIFNPYINSLILVGVMGDIDPSTVPKFIEVYALEDIPDLSLYGLGSANDGLGSDGEEFTFPAVALTAGTFVTVATNTTDYNAFFGSAPDYVDVVAPNIDGNDAVELFFNGAVIDVYGEINNTNGRIADWAYTNGWAHRASETEQDGSLFEPLNWEYSGPDGLDVPTRQYPAGIEKYTLTPLGSLTTIPVTLTVSNDGGVTTDTCVAMVTVEDVTQPVPICLPGPITLQLDNTGTVFINALLDIAGLPDNAASIAMMDSCGASVRAEPSAFFCADIGMPQTVTLIVTDISGNQQTCTTTAIVEDNVAPDAICTPLTVTLDVNGNATITPEDVGGLSTDACGIATTSLDISTFDCSDIGPNTITYTVIDNYGNTSSCSTIVTVEDTLAPNVVCQNITVPLDTNGMVTISAIDVDNGSAAACGIANRSIDINSFDCDDIGPNNVVLTVIDNNGNSANCIATVTVADQTPPVPMAMDISVVLGINGTVGIAGSDLNNGSTDNCGINSFTAMPNSLTCADVGAPVPVNLIVTDNSGNTATAVAMVTVLDNTAPVATCQNITIQLDGAGNATITPADIDGGSSVSCGSLNLTIDTNSFSCADVGPNNVLLTVTNDSGAMSSCTAVVTVEDTVAPNVICQDINLFLNAAGNATITANDVDNGSTDFCGIASRTLSQSSFDCSDIGTNNITLTITDFNGNSQSCVAVVTVSDTIAPLAICQNITVQLNASGMVTVDAIDVDGGSSDFCGITSRTIDVSNFDCNNIGANTVTLTVMDGSGNIDSCMAIVTVEDNIDPVAVCQNITVPLDASGNVFVTALDLDGGSSDNCGINSISISNGLFTCNNVGSNTVTLTVSDNSGNSSSCLATVTIVDTQAPTVICQNITVALDASGTASINATNIDGGSTDACGVASTTISQSTFDCSNLGPNNVVLTLTDLYGNSASCTAIVTVIDSVDPSVTCPQPQTVIIPLGSQYTVPNYFGSGLASAIDNCTNPITNVTQNPAAGTLVGAGMYTISVTAEDDSGNTDSCNFQLTVDTTLGIGESRYGAQIKIVPNPAKNKITLHKPITLQLTSMIIYDLAGRSVVEIPLNLGVERQDIDISNLQAASYFIILNGTEGSVVKQLIKQ